jgi:hypothetical protein
MPSIDYPSNPIAGQTATYSNGNVVIFDGSAWRSSSTGLPTGTSSVYFGFNGFISSGLSYTKIADNTIPTAGQISFIFSEGEYFAIYVSKITSNGEDVSDLLSLDYSGSNSFLLTPPVTFTLQNESGSYFISYEILYIDPESTYYSYDFGAQTITPPAPGTPLILNFPNNIYGENSFTTTFVSDSNVISNSVITLMPMTSSNHQSLDDFSIEGISLTVGEITPNTGFNVYASALNNTWGTYNFKYTIINK